MLSVSFCYENVSIFLRVMFGCLSSIGSCRMYPACFAAVLNLSFDLRCVTTEGLLSLCTNLMADPRICIRAPSNRKTPLKLGFLDPASSKP